MTFFDGDTPLRIIPVKSGKATLTTSRLPIGGNSIRAVFSGSSTLEPSESAVVAEIVVSRQRQPRHRR